MLSPAAPSSRSILVQIEHQVVAVLSTWITEIIFIKREEILSLPFYGHGIVGVVHHQGQVLPVVTPQVVFPDIQVSPRLTHDQLTALCCSDQVPAMAGVVVVVDRIIGMRSGADLAVAEKILQPQLPTRLSPTWHPLQWRSSE